MNSTKPLKNELKHEVKDAIAILHGLRDELRLQIHLGGMEARDKLAVLEQDLEKLQSTAKHATELSTRALMDAFQELKASLTAKSSRVN